MNLEQLTDWFSEHTPAFITWEWYLDRRCMAAMQFRGPVVQRLADAAYCLDSPN